eukprot:gene41971-52024_t
MDISEVAKRSGLRASTLRYYEEKGLVSSVGLPNSPTPFPRSSAASMPA